MDRPRRSVGNVVVLVALGVGPAACGRSCGCVEGEKTYERLDGKVEVSLVRKVRWAGGRVGGPLTDFFVRVATTPPFDEPVRGCDHVDLAEDEAGKNVAFRCKGTASWTVLRLRGGDRRLRECDATVGTGRKPTFEKLEPVRSATKRILDCEGSEPMAAIEELVRAVNEDEGEQVAAELVVSLADRPLLSSQEKDPWDVALHTLDPGGRERAMTQLCAVLPREQPLASSETWVRAAVRCPLDAPGIGAGSLAMLRRQLPDGAEPPVDAGVHLLPAPRALVWSALIATEKEPAEAGAIACKAAGGGQRHDPRGGAKSVVAWILGRTGTSCDAVTPWLTPAPCSPYLDCDGGLCSKAELGADMARWTEALALDGGLRADPNVPASDNDRIAVFAAHARGPLPREIILPNERRRYPFANADAGLPSCSEAQLEVGAPCICTEIRGAQRCKVPVSETRVRDGYCAGRFDDAKKRIDDVRRICEPEGATCNWSTILCCDGLRCEPGVGRCKKAGTAGGDAKASDVGEQR